MKATLLQLTLDIPVTFKPAFAGTKTVYMQTEDLGGLRTEWLAKGTWTVPGGGNQPPQAISISPSSGNGAVQTFALVYSDPNGASDLSWTEFIANSTLQSANACYVRYERATNRLWLRDDAGTSWMGPLVPPNPGVLQNQQCALDSGASSASNSGPNLTETVSLTFASSFEGAKNAYMRAQDNGGAASDWRDLGDWTVVAFPQCEWHAGSLGIDRKVIRQAGNLVYSYNKTWVYGPYYQWWWPHVSASGWLNGVRYHGPVTHSAAPGDLAQVSINGHPQQLGPGTYSIIGDHWAQSPSCESMGYRYEYAHYPSTDSRLVERPVISMDHPIWWLGPGVVENNLLPATGQLTADPKGAPETPQWTITAGASNPQRIVLSCATCLVTTATALARSAGCQVYDAKVKATVGGFDSQEFFIFIDGPVRMQRTVEYHLDYPEFNPGVIGYKSHFHYQIIELCEDPLYLSVNEQFTAWGKDNPDSTWPIPVPEGSWPFFDYDTIFAAGALGDFYPQPQKPPPTGVNCYESSASPKVMWHTQEFRAGSTTKGSGVLLQRNKAQWYEDHGCHEERQSPVP